MILLLIYVYTYNKYFTIMIDMSKNLISMHLGDESFELNRDDALQLIGAWGGETRRTFGASHGSAW